MTALISFVRNLVINVWLPLSWTREVDYEENDAITKIDEKKKKRLEHISNDLTIANWHNQK